MADGAAVMLAGLLRGGRAGRAAAAGGAVLRGVLGCNDVGGAAALSAGSCAAGEAGLPADRAAARQTGLLRCERSCGAAGGAAVLLAGLMLRTVLMRGGKCLYSEQIISDCGKQETATSPNIFWNFTEEGRSHVLGTWPGIHNFNFTIWAESYLYLI